jgi:hypothetical protein
MCKILFVGAMLASLACVAQAPARADRLRDMQWQLDDIQRQIEDQQLEREDADMMLRMRIESLRSEREIEIEEDRLERDIQAGRCCAALPEVPPEIRQLQLHPPAPDPSRWNNATSFGAK